MPVRKLSELLALPKPEITYLIKPSILMAGGTMVLYGPPDSFKSWLTVEMAASLAQGTSWIGYETTACKVLVVQAEQSENLYQERIEAYTTARNIDIQSINERLLFFNEVGISLDKYNGFKTLDDILVEERPNVVIIDCLYRVVDSESDVGSIGKFLQNIGTLQGKYQFAGVIVHHTRKQGRDNETEDRGIEEMSGLGTFGRWVDSVAKISRINKGEGRLVSVEWQKQKNVAQVLHKRVVRVGEDLTFKVM